MKSDGWFMSTPTGKNDFYKLCMRGKDAQEQKCQCWQMPTLLNRSIDLEEIEDARKVLPHNAFRQEYQAEFLENIANPFGYPYIQQCTFPLSTQPPICFGIDLVKSFDYTVIIGLDRNGSVCWFDRFQKGWRETAQAIMNLPNVPMAIDSTGVGDPVAEDIARNRADVEMFKFTQTSKQQLMEGLAVAIQQRKVTFPEGPIKDELEDFEFMFTRSGVRYAAPTGLHDDCVCSLALAWHKWRPSSSYGHYSIM